MMMIARGATAQQDRVTVLREPTASTTAVTGAPLDGGTVARQSSRRNPTVMVTW